MHGNGEYIVKYKPTEKFKELTIHPNHQNLERQEFLAFRRGETVECSPPKQLIDEGYLEKVVKKKEVSHGNSK